MERIMDILAVGQETGTFDYAPANIQMAVIRLAILYIAEGINKEQKKIYQRIGANLLLWQ